MHYGTSAESAEQPSAREFPIPLDCCNRDAQHFGDFLFAEPSEETKFNDAA